MEPTPEKNVTEVKKDDVELVREAREKLKSENDLLEAERLRAERLRAEEILGGGSRAGAPVEPVVETPKQYKDRVMRGLK